MSYKNKHVLGDCLKDIKKWTKDPKVRAKIEAYKKNRKDANGIFKVFTIHEKYHTLTTLSKIEFLSNLAEWFEMERKDVIKVGVV